MKISKSFTLVEVLVGIALMLIVFLGIFGAYQLGVRVVGQSKNRTIATAIANSEIEKVRNLPYESIGVQGSFPEGILDEESEIIQNNINFKVERRVDYVVDPADGIASPDDDCPNDYKRLEVKVSWTGQFGGETKLYTDVAPKNLAQECANSGGILSISIFDAYGMMVSSPLIEVKDPLTDETIKSATPSEGKHYFSLVASTYKVVVSKEGYSLEQTFSIGQIYNGKTIVTPEKPHPIVIEGQLTEISFSVDKVSAFSVDTLSPWGESYFSDSFLNETKISESSSITISNGEVNLLKTDEEYSPSGYLISTTIVPESLINWEEFSFTDNKPVGTQILYQVLYFDGENWVLIPDTDLSGNSAGFGTSPIDLSGLSIDTYSQLQLKGNLSTQNSVLSPTLYNWQISWKTSDAVPIPNIVFHLQGEKIIGLDEEEEPIYKYSQNKVSNSSGHIDISNLEWDSYTLYINQADGLDLVNIDPSPQPISLLPDTTLEVKLYLDAQNSLLVTVQNMETLEPVFSATVRLYKTGYDTTQYTDEKGQTYFIPLEIATYNLEIQAAGYSNASAQVSVSGDETETIKLEQIE